MKLANKTYFDAYTQRLGQQIEAWFKAVDFSEAAGDLGYKTAASAVYSSNIEGNTIDLNTFMNLKLAEKKFRHGKEVDEIEDLIAAYEFAQQRPLSEKHLLKAHQILLFRIPGAPALRPHPSLFRWKRAGGAAIGEMVFGGEPGPGGLEAAFEKML